MRRFTGIHRILLRSANWVGDALMTTPAVRAVKRNFPGAAITLLAKPWVMPVFEGNPHVDRLMVYDTQERHRGRTGLVRLARDLRACRFDMALLFQNAFEAALLSWMAGIPRRLGYTTDARTCLLTDRLGDWRRLKKGHLIDYYLGLIAGAGLATDGRRMDLFISRAERNDAAVLLERFGAGCGVAGLNPGATQGTAKRWPADRFAALSRRLHREHGLVSVIFGGASESALGEEIARRAGGACINLAGRTRLRQAMALIAGCDVFITNDSGLMHVAAALDIPQVAIIGPTDPVATGPVNEASVLVRGDRNCDRSPCLLDHCPIDHRCMTAVSVDEVAAAVGPLMVRYGRRRPGLAS